MTKIVIPCRGKSTRTQEYKKGNKVFYEFDGKYFIEYLINYLLNQGIDNTDIYILYTKEYRNHILAMLLDHSVCTIEGNYKPHISDYFEEIDEYEFILMFGDNYYPDLNLHEFIESDAQVVGKRMPNGGYSIDGKFCESRYESYIDLGIYKIDKDFYGFLCDVGSTYKNIFHAIIRYYQKDLKFYEYSGKCFDVGSLDGIEDFKKYVEAK